MTPPPPLPRAWRIGLFLTVLALMLIVTYCNWRAP